jgi:hypothetical protein
MKKIYLAPRTEAIQLLGENTIMNGSGYLDPLGGVRSDGGTGPMM